MDKLDQQMIKLWNSIKKFCTSHKTISIFIGMTLLFLVFSSFAYHPRLSWDRGFDRPMIWWRDSGFMKNW